MLRKPVRISLQKIRDKARKNKRQSIIFKPCFPLQARARTPGPDPPASPAWSGAAAPAAAALGHHPDRGPSARAEMELRPGRACKAMGCPPGASGEKLPEGQRGAAPGKGKKEGVSASTPGLLGPPALLRGGLGWSPAG